MLDMNDMNDTNDTNASNELLIFNEEESSLILAIERSRRSLANYTH